VKSAKSSPNPSIGCDEGLQGASDWTNKITPTIMVDMTAEREVLTQRRVIDFGIVGSTSCLHS
jgi:hypothetical protein